MNMDAKIINGYNYAREYFSELGVDVDRALATLDSIPISMHCWQGDDFHALDGQGALSGGIAVTGNHPGCPRNVDELRADIVKAVSLIPGPTKLNLHSSYAQLGNRKRDRDAYTIEDFAEWVDFAKQNNMGLDFNPTFFSHPNMDGNFTLASQNDKVRRFWIEHGKRCREIGQEMGRQIGQKCIVDYWMPDGFKDTPADGLSYRKRMLASLDEIFAEKMDDRYIDEAIESKLFGFGIESFTVASHEFALGYAITRKKAYCLDCGHFHPTEDMSDKISSMMQYIDHLLIYTSRGVRWDSDHVVTYDDGLKKLMREVVAGNYLDRVYIAQDYFDGSMNRIACWTVAMRNTRKALLYALLEPRATITAYEESGDFSARFVGQEAFRTAPVGAIWDYYCASHNYPTSSSLWEEISKYDREVLSKR